MKKFILLILFAFLLLTNCSKYQVVSELQVNLYHMHNPKTGEIQVIVTKDKLEVGSWYRLNRIDIIEK